MISLFYIRIDCFARYIHKKITTSSVLLEFFPGRQKYIFGVLQKTLILLSNCLMTRTIFIPRKGDPLTDPSWGVIKEGGLKSQVLKTFEFFVRSPRSRIFDRGRTFEVPKESEERTFRQGSHTGVALLRFSRNPRNRIFDRGRSFEDPKKS